MTRACRCVPYHGAFAVVAHFLAFGLPSSQSSLSAISSKAFFFLAMTDLSVLLALFMRFVSPLERSRYPLDAGTDMRSIFKALQTFGDCTEALSPDTIDPTLSEYSDPNSVTRPMDTCRTFPRKSWSAGSRKICARPYWMRRWSRGGSLGSFDSHFFFGTSFQV